MKKITVIPGDDAGPETVGVAVRAMEYVAPGIEITFADYGRSSWEYTNEVLPEKTEDIIANSDVILCGPANVTDISKKNPMDIIILNNDLYTYATEYIALPKISKGIDACIASPLSSFETQISEIEKLYGVDAQLNADYEVLKRFYLRSAELAKVRGRNEITLACYKDLLPSTSRFQAATFGEVLNGVDIENHVLSLDSACGLLSQNPTEAGMFVADALAATPLRGIASGLTGGPGIMADVFLGDRLSLYTSQRNMPDIHQNNPTSMIMAAIMLLRDIGLARESRKIMRALRKVYEEKMMTSDVGGKKRTTIDDFTSTFYNYLENDDYDEEEQAVE